MDVVTNIAGAVHDVRIWASCNLQHLIEQQRILQGPVYMYGAHAIPQVSSVVCIGCCFCCTARTFIFFAFPYKLYMLHIRSTSFSPAQMIGGDSAYPSTRHMIAVHKRRAADTPEEAARKEHYNKCLASARILVEQTIGSVKCRFPILMNQSRLRRQTLPKVFLASCALHNFLVESGYGYFELSELPPLALEGIFDDENENEDDDDEDEDADQAAGVEQAGENDIRSLVVDMVNTLPEFDTIVRRVTARARAGRRAQMLQW